MCHQWIAFWRGLVSHGWQPSGCPYFIAAAQAFAHLVLNVLWRRHRPGRDSVAARSCRRGGLRRNCIQPCIREPQPARFFALPKHCFATLYAFQSPGSHSLLDFDSPQLAVDSGDDAGNGSRKDGVELNVRHWVRWGGWRRRRRWSSIGGKDRPFQDSQVLGGVATGGACGPGSRLGQSRGQRGGWNPSDITQSAVLVDPDPGQGS